MLTVEDGTLVGGADSYVSLTFARDYAHKRGIYANLASLTDEQIAIEPVVSPALDWEQYLRRGFDYINRQVFEGYKVMRPDDPVPTQFPRSETYLDGCRVPADSVPVIVLHAQIEAAVAYEALKDPEGDYQEKILIGKTVGPITKQYNPYSYSNANNWVIKKVDAILFQLLYNKFEVKR